MRRAATVSTLSAAACLAVAFLTGQAVAQESAGAAAELQGLRAWNSDLLTKDMAPPSGGAVAPVVIAAARNGSFSGKVGLSAAGPIRNLRVTCGHLKAGEATLPARAVRIRYAVANAGKLRGGWRDPSGLDVLLESAPAEFAAPEGGAAMVAVWVTVDVPRDAAPGAYRGEITLAADGAGPITVPVHVSVADWALPETADWRTWVGMVQSPDTLAVEYGLDLWSERHWSLVARSMKLIGETGCRVVYVPLICFTNFGNAESMVRWVDKGEGRFDHDFSVMDRYLDTAAQHMGKPKLVIFNVWDIYLKPGSERWGDAWYSKVAEDRRQSDHVKKLKARGDLHRELQKKYGAGPAVTAIDAAAKKAETKYLPPYNDAVAKGLWAPLFAELRKRMKNRGLEGRLLLGMLSDSWPRKDEVATLHEASGGLPWVVHSHAGVHAKGRTRLHGLADITYETCVWPLRFSPDPSKERTYGWQRKELVAEYDRGRFFNAHPLMTIRCVAEYNITGHQRGVAKIGADFWNAVKNKQGRRVGNVTARYPQSMWRSLDVGSSILAPSPDGPVATVRYENFREGVQECEARIFIETALIDETLRAKIGGDLANRCQALLDERVAAMWHGAGGPKADPAGTAWRYKADEKGHAWFVRSGWQERTAKLYALAGEVAEKTGKK